MSTAYTILGAQKTIPYKVEIIRQAYNALYPAEYVATLQPNYLYVRFLPQSPADVKALLDTGLEFWDFPLDREIVALGERYHDPALSDSMYTWQYAVVKPNFNFPSVQYQVLEPLALVPEDSQVAKKAFELTQNEYDEPDEYEPTPKIKNGVVDFELPNDDIKPNYVPEVPGPGPLLFNPTPCGCPLPDNVRKPSGCVTVQDNRLNIYDPVREVRVITARDRVLGLIFNKHAYTNDKGCWEVNKKYKSKIHVWVKFESATCNIKTMNSNNDLWGYTFPRKAYIGKFGGPNFNNIPIQFDWTNNIDTRQFRNWVASTINNSIYETQRHFAFLGLPHPPGNLKILVTQWGDGNSGAAPMLDKSPSNSTILTSALVVGGTIGGVFLFSYEIANAAAATLFHLDLPNSSVGSETLFGGALLAPIIGVAAPDIVFNMNNPDDVETDDIRDISYHELAHSIHFLRAGEAYWLDEIIYTIVNNGYGDGNTPGHGRVEVVEAWGFQMGYNMAHIRYGDAHSEGLFNSWLRQVENRRFDSGFIPFGWQHDLVDMNSENPTDVDEPVVNGVPLPDNIVGFHNSEIFRTMGPGMLSVEEQKQALQTLLATKGISQANYDALAAAYGF
jgi:hypothetical protein